MMLEDEFKQLEEKIDLLLSNTNNHRKEVRALQESELALTEERTVLIRKNDLAKSKIEAMITRLKSLEQA